MDSDPEPDEAACLRDEFDESFLIFVDIIKQELKARGVNVPLVFIINMVKLAVLDPVNKFMIKQQMVPAEVERLKRIVVEKVIGMSEISRNLIRMQYSFRDKCLPKEQIISVHHEEVNSKILPLLEELKLGVAKRNQYEIYYSKLIAATIYHADMGPPTEVAVVNETRAAIEKVFHVDDVTRVNKMQPEKREIEVTRIIQIAVGLRLIKKELNAASSSGTEPQYFEDLPKVLLRKMSGGIKQIKSMKSLATGRLIKYTAAIEKYFMTQYMIRGGRRQINSRMLQARQGLTMVHQVLICIKQLIELLEKEERFVETTIARFRSVSKDILKEKRKHNVGPSAALYVWRLPKYMSLCHYWKELVDANIYASHLIQISTDIVQFSETDLIEMDDFMEEFITAQEIEVPSEHDFFNVSTQLVDLDNTANAFIKRLEYRPEQDPQKFNFTGFCPNSLVRGVGMLLYGNPHLGVFTWRNKSFIFSTDEAVTEFCRNPEVVIRRALGIARRWPELIILLDVEAEAYDPSSINQVDCYRKFFSGVLVSKSAEMQSETHPIPKNIVQAYTWNEWELRRRGIILSKIHKCRTHGTQTYWQAVRKTVPIQTYGKKTQEVQTNRNIHTQVPRTKFYFAGLRGYHCGMPPHIVEMTTENLDDLHCLCKPLLRKEKEAYESDD